MNLNSIGSFLKRIFNWSLFKETYKEWSNDKASRLAAALAYYTATAIAPLVVGILAIVGFVFNREQAQAQLVAQVYRYVGSQGGEIVETILANADQPDLARLAGLFSLATLLWSASNIFVQLQDSLDTIWGVQMRPDLPFIRKVQHRLLPLLTVFGIGLLLLVAVIATTALTAVGTLVSDLLPGGALLWQVVNFLISITIITLLFGVVFKVLPDVDIAWSAVWPGAALTALLFQVGQFVLGWYLGRQSGASLYGAAGSLIILLLWLYYTAQIFLFGAEFTQVYATRYGQGVRPAKDAVARDDSAAKKPAAQAANAGTDQRHPQPNRIEAGHVTQTWQRASTSSDELSIGGLVAGLVDDGRRLFRQETLLARVEMQEALAQVMRYIAAMAGGQLVLYASVMILLSALSVLLGAMVPLWFATLLVGLLALIVGGLRVRSGLRALKQLRPVPKQTIDSLREDVEMVKDHLTT
jgi:membrane protein